MPEFKPFDYGQAVAQGQQNALRQAQMMDVTQNVQGRNMLNTLAQEGVTGANKYNALVQEGRPDLARQEQAKDMQMQTAQLSQDSAKLKYVSDSTRNVFNQPSLDAWKQNMYDRGLAEPGELADFDTYDPVATQGLFRRMRGEAKNNLNQIVEHNARGQARERLYAGEEEVGRGEWYTPIQRIAQGSPDAWSKPAQTKIEKQLIDERQLSDKLTNGMNFMLGHRDLFDIGSKMTAGVGNAIELLGVDPPEWMAKEVKDMAQLDRYSLDIVNVMRKAITGAQASFSEIDKFILPMVRKGTDAKSRAFIRMQGAVMANEMAIVRLNQLKRQGYQVVSKPGSQTMVVQDANGNKQSVQDVMKLGSVPTFNKRKSQLMEQMAQGKKRADIPQKIQSQMYLEALDVMAKEGYNMDVSRKDWVK